MKGFLSQFIKSAAKVSLAIACSLVLLVGFANPASAFGNSSSHPSEGTAQMNDLQATSEKALKSEPRSQEEIQARAQRGPNEVQGDADLDKMNRQSNSSTAKTVMEQAEDALSNITPGN